MSERGVFAPWPLAAAGGKQGWKVRERVAETQDEELAYAYHAANNKEGPFDHKRSNQAYTRRAYPIYPPYLVERIVAMLFKVVGLKPHSRLSRLVSRRANRFIPKRARQHTMAGA